MDLTAGDFKAAASGLPAHGVVMESTPAASDTDRATVQTVEKMCAYIRGAVSDPLVEQAAATAWRVWGAGAPSDSMKAWGVFWFVKHLVKFRLDEGAMLSAGLHDEQDLLIDPRVLLRMRKPAEDCDGFTMLVAALLSCLHIPVYIATVAVDPKDPSRWSHVFPIAVLDGKTVPLDTSHGPRPGWMVPPSEIRRFQAWDLDGRPADHIRLTPRGLNGYVPRGRAMIRRPRRGVGDTCYDTELQPYDCASATDPLPYLQDSTPILGPVPLSSGSPAAPGSSIWSFLSNLIGTAGNVARTAVTPSTTVTYPSGTTVTGPAGAFPIAGTSVFSNPIVLIGGAVVLGLFVVSAMKKGR
jgi:hypothetical protein